eukprot:3543351-Lingulodinium_polyedra.AAC.1
MVVRQCGSAPRAERAPRPAEPAPRADRRPPRSLPRLQRLPQRLLVLRVPRPLGGQDRRGWGATDTQRAP